MCGSSGRGPGVNWTGEGARPEDHCAEPQGAPRLQRPRHLRGRCRADGHRGQEPAAGARVARRLLRHHRRRRGVAARPAHPRVHARQLDEPRAAAQPQAVAVLPRRQGQAGARAGARQARLRQAAGPGQARRRPGDLARLRPGGEGARAGDAVTVPSPPRDDADVPRFLADLGVPGIVDVHVHFLPENVLQKVWGYFDQAQEHYGMPWPVHYRLPEPDRVAVLEKLGVAAFAPLVYPHRPGMARWLTGWVTAFADATPGAVWTATLFPEPDVTDYL